VRGPLWRAGTPPCASPCRAALAAPHRKEGRNGNWGCILVFISQRVSTTLLGTES